MIPLKIQRWWYGALSDWAQARKGDALVRAIRLRELADAADSAAAKYRECEDRAWKCYERVDALIEEIKSF